MHQKPKCKCKDCIYMDQLKKFEKRVTVVNACLNIRDPESPVSRFTKCPAKLRKFHSDNKGGTRAPRNPFRSTPEHPQNKTSEPIPG